MAKLINLPTFSDPRGQLTVFEKNIPFQIKRVFFIHDVTATRGGHGHKNTQMALVALSGSITVSGQTPSADFEFTLSHPSQCLVLSPEDWHEMHSFSENASLVVLASHEYDKDDYFTQRYRP